MINRTPAKADQSIRREYRIILGVLLFITLGVSILVSAVLIANRPLSAEAITSTAAALPGPTMPPTSTPTPIPTVPGVTEALLVCQRNAGFAMNERNLVGAVNISDDHLFLLSWIARDWTVGDLDDALPGVVLGFDAALDVWQGGCAVYDRVRIDVWDRRAEKQVHQLTVQVQMDDLLQWRAGRLSDSELIARLQVTRPENTVQP
jgi:hypothetical protein